MQRRHQRAQGRIQADSAAAASTSSNIASPSSSSSSSFTSLLPPPIKAVYIACPQPFESVERFVRFSVRHYHLRLRTVHGGMKQGLEEYLSGGGQPFSYPPLPSSQDVDGAGVSSQNGAYAEEESAHSGANVTAIFIGTRATDPNGPSLFSQSSTSSAGSPAPANGHSHAQSQSASPTPEQQQAEGLRAWTDKDWPRVERIHPILSWSYSDVWDFLRCPLFGYAPLVGGGQSGAAGANDGAAEGSAGGIQRANGAQERWSDEQLEQEGCARSTGVPYCLLYDLG